MGKRNHLSTGQLLSEALKHHQAGRLGEAAAGYQAILQQNPKHSDALHLLGVTAQQLDKLDMAVELMKAAIAQNPAVPHYHHNLGNTYLKNRHAAEAVNCYRQAILLKPDYFEAHFGMGNALAELSQFEIAAEAYRMAVTLQPSFAEGHYNLGRMLSKLDRLDAAVSSYYVAIKLDGKHPEYFFNLGGIFLKQEDYPQAIQSFQAALELQPEDPETLCRLGTAHYALKRYPESELFLRRAISIRPDFTMAYLQLGALLAVSQREEEAKLAYKVVLGLDPTQAEAIWGLGNLCLQVKDYAEAEKNFRAALKYKPNDPIYCRSLAQSLIEQGNYGEGADLCRSAIAVNPNYLDAYCGLGIALLKMGDYSGAEDSFHKALAINSNHRETRYNLGGLFKIQFKFSEAIICYQQVLKPDAAENIFEWPLYIPAIYNLGISLLENGQVDDAITCYREALQHFPDDVMLHNNLAVVLLKAGRLVEGWEEMEWRWKNPAFPTKLRDFGCPMWRGESLNGAKIFLHIEQGYGDILQMVRYLPMVADRGGRIILESPPSLRRLLSSIADVEQIIITRGNLPEFSYHCPLMSLPRAFETSLATIPSSVPYLSVPEDEIMSAKRKWPGAGLRVGLVWSGNPEHYADAHRSMRFEQMGSIGQIAGVSFYSLQVGIAARQIIENSSDFQIADVCSGYTDFADTAAFVAGLDLVITVDTSVAHLAGALGVSVWILLAYEHVDWRWLLDRSDSPWYPSARLFRQEKSGDWAGVMDRVRVELSNLVSEYASGNNSKMVVSR